MTVEEIEARVAAIVAVKDDDEMAHNWEDKLHREVLRFIARDTSFGLASDLAATALKTREIEFSRWCA